MPDPTLTLVELVRLRAATEAQLREPGADLDYLNDVLAEVDAVLALPRLCRHCGRPVMACPDPACDYHHARPGGLADYPKDCKADLELADLEPEL